MNKSYKSNEERTNEYLMKFDRVKLLKNLIKSDKPTLLDVGANEGQTLEEFLKIWPHSRIVSFEPQHECREALLGIKSKYVNSNITIIDKAVGKVSGADLPFYVHDVSSGLSGFNRINLNSKDSIRLSELDSSSEEYKAYAAQVNHSRNISCIRLDQWLSENKIDHIDLLKIDTQGFESQVLEGMGEQLASVDVVLTELMFYDYYERSLSFSDIEKFLIPAGFSLFDISHISKNPMNGRTDWVDVIYVNNRIR